MAKPPLLVRLLASALRSNRGTRRELAQINTHLGELVSLKRRELGLPAEGQPQDAAPTPVDLAEAQVGEAHRLEVTERVINEFVDTYFRDPTEAELVARVEAELKGAERGQAPVAAPQPRPRVWVDPPGPETASAEELAAGGADR